MLLDRKVRLGLCLESVEYSGQLLLLRAWCLSFRIFSLVFSSVEASQVLKHLLLNDNDSIQSRLLHSVRVASFFGETSAEDK